MDQLEAMRVFVRVAELSSFTKAAEDLGMPKAAASQAVKELEGRLGVALLRRTTRVVQVTHDGSAFLERCRDLLDDFEETASMFQSGASGLSGRLRVDMAAGIARRVVLPRLPEFLKDHPDLAIDISSTDRQVDVIAEGFDCVLRVGASADSGLMQRRLGVLPQMSCASRAYVESKGLPRDLEDLRHLDLIHYVRQFGGRSPGFEYVDAEGTHSVAMKGRITVNNSDAYQAACLAGFGIIQAPTIGFRHHLASGEMVAILPAFPPPALPVSLIFPSRRHLPKRSRHFFDWLESVLRPELS